MFMASLDNVLAGEKKPTIHRSYVTDSRQEDENSMMSQRMRKVNSMMHYVIIILSISCYGHFGREIIAGMVSTARLLLLVDLFSPPFFP